MQAWTSGAQTYIRIRPATNTPPVAKVARHTPLFVWGKWGNWYRVETHDHIFGWVNAAYINAPDLHKVAAMSYEKAIDASDRTGHQVMFGTPDELRAYYDRFGAEGARKGLALHGVYLPEKSKFRLASSSVKPRKEAKPAKERVAAPAPKVAKAAVAIPVVTPATASQIEAPKIVLAPQKELLVPIAEVGSLAPAPSEQVVASASKIAAAPQNVAPMQVKSLAPVKAAKAPKLRRTAPASRRMTRWERARQNRLAAQQKKVERLRAKVGFAAKPQAAMPVVPAPIAVQPVAPISPTELLRARENHLRERQQRLGTPLTPVGEVAPLPNPGPLSHNAEKKSAPVALSNQKLAPGSVISLAYSGVNPRGTATMGGPVAPQITYVDENGKIQSATMPLLPASSSRLVQENLASLHEEILAPVVVANAQLSPSKAAPAGNRGGSMLDRYRKPGDGFGQGVTKQALSYRGKRYVFGSANPSRGFDCSGLVYYLLRSRGLNPPRTAAGYRNYGQSVSKSELKSGDLLLFANTYKRGISHIGIYMGNNKFVHAASTGQGVRVDSLSKGYFAKKYHSARRVK